MSLYNNLKELVSDFFLRKGFEGAMVQSANRGSKILDIYVKQEYVEEFREKFLNKQFSLGSDRKGCFGKSRFGENVFYVSVTPEK